MKKNILMWFMFLMLAFTPAAFAYVGPGAGLSLLSALWGLLLALGAAIGFIVFWPLRRLRQRARVTKAMKDDKGDV